MKKAEGQSDHEILLSSIQRPSVFASIVERYQEAFLRKARSIIGNDDDAKDIVQETFVKIYANARKFEERENAAFSSWGYKILLNTCFTHAKKSKRENLNLSYDDSLEYREEDLQDDTPRMDRFLIVLSKLPRDCAKLLRALVVEGKSQGEVATEEGIKDGTLRVRIHRAKTLFKKALVEYPNL